MVKDAFSWKAKNKLNWKLFLQIIIVIALILGIEHVSYFYVGKSMGKLIGRDNTTNLQLPFDTVFPWISWIYPFYMLWPFMWFVVIPLVIYFASGKKQYYRYVVNAFLMYIIGTIIYIFLPTTCTPSYFIVPTADHLDWGGVASVHPWYHLLQPGDAFYSQLSKLAADDNNIWGSCPSYHNYWASLLVLFAFYKGIKWYYRTPMIIVGLLITLSTLGLHQHNITDVVITYGMTILFIYVEKYFDLSKKTEKLLNKLFFI